MIMLRKYRQIVDPRDFQDTHSRKPVVLLEGKEKQHALGIPVI